MRPTIAPPCGDAAWPRCSGLHALPACRSLGGPHVAGSVAASDPAAGVNGARGGLRLSSPPDAVAVWPSASAVWTRSRGERDHRISEAQPRSGGRRERARVGELGIWKPGILPRVRGLPRLPGFQIFSSSPRRRPRRARPAGGGAGAGGCGRRPGELETWNSGIRAARRGAGRRGPAVARSARVGRTRAAAMASPMARRRASRVPRGTRLRRVLARVLANACSTGNRSQSVGARLDAHRQRAVASLSEHATHEGTEPEFH